MLTTPQSTERRLIPDRFLVHPEFPHVQFATWEVYERKKRPREGEEGEEGEDDEA